ncbi:MAG: imidazole glycerol phosphate synthase subunit HisH [Rhodospirillales bacterium CG15_BIG_FIL_POST_REV_8_21_14_020_66_15]|nr:MAG: imidazole glycerol phosphate synthase subunit HisH [Rhodospirillales bacterium CG15_BIG_FIL_POST_REV_8_21_14_020_66_15]
MTIALIDYGSGNLRSAAKAFERVLRGLGRTDAVRVTSDPETVAAADRVVLPGVGAFGDCRAGIQAIDGMAEALTEAVIARGRPFLGICVGMQLMATSGFEFGEHPGFGWIPGAVRALDPVDKTLKIPHMGWNELFWVGYREHPVLKDLANGQHAYFVHSFHLVPENAEHLLAVTDYGGPVTAAVGRDNLVGTQFHPEKSQAVGLKLIENFLEWKP